MTKPTADKQTCECRVYLTAEEKAIVKKAAELDGERFSPWARDALLLSARLVIAEEVFKLRGYQDLEMENL